MARLGGFCVLCGLAFCSASVRAVDTQSMLETDLNGEHVEGRMLYQHEQQLGLLARDGHWWNFKADAATNARWSNEAFRPYTSSELRRRLERELGERFEVSSTRHFVVAYPLGQKEIWPDRFEELYASCVHYFSVRGFTLHDPEFPLVAIVWHNKAEFQEAGRHSGTVVRDEIVGFYWQITNRLMMYDQGGAATKSRNWQETADTIVHEATHQTAFNIGIHNRFVHNPDWVCEGLATMFEPAGVHDSRNFPDRADRINRTRLEQFRQYQATKRTATSLQELITSDQRFKSDPQSAYAEAWAFTFFLVETQPRDYAQFLQKTAQRPPFRDYSDRDRYADFVSVFGSDFRMLDARFARFIKELK
ncbi:MAG TPA: DUF1570 domain-containing protein [Pirellulales bacterium]|jgi:hypothetical protein|nr:DUF1570 domain-containing protein [Pirellulales bacterium]